MVSFYLFLSFLICGEKFVSLKSLTLDHEVRYATSTKIKVNFLWSPKCIAAKVRPKCFGKRVFRWVPRPEILGEYLTGGWVTPVGKLFEPMFDSQTLIYFPVWCVYAVLAIAALPVGSLYVQWMQFDRSLLDWHDRTRALDGPEWSNWLANAQRCHSISISDYSRYYTSYYGRDYETTQGGRIGTYRGLSGGLFKVSTSDAVWCRVLRCRLCIVFQWL